jgi:hypothetical protein
MRRTVLLVAAVTILCVAPSTATRQATSPADPLVEWSVVASSAAAASGMAPLRTPITLALLHLAMYDAVNAIAGDHEPYVIAPAVAHPASPHVAAIEAGYHVLLEELPSQRGRLDQVHEQLLAAVPDSPAKTNGAAVGASAARHLLAARAGDGRNASVTYEPGSGPGSWIPTPPGFLAATTAFLATVRPFTMDRPGRFRPGGPPRLRSGKFATDYNEVKTFGANDSIVRTPEQTATARFWEPLAGTVWVPTIRRLAREQLLDLPSSARFQAAAFAAFADGLIACWDAKFHFNFWRPVTAIQEGDADENRRTAGDTAWVPLAVTPNFPEYPSGHACATAAVTDTIENFLGRDVAIPARNVVTGEERVYQDADEAVDEVIEARMLLGIHFRSANEDGGRHRPQNREADPAQLLQTAKRPRVPEPMHGSKLG